MADGDSSDDSDIVFKDALPRPPDVLVLSDGTDSDPDEIKILDATKVEASRRAAAVVASAAPPPVASTSNSTSTSPPLYPPDYPLPKVTKPWDLKRFMPMRNPPPDGHLGKGKQRAVSIELGIDPEPEPVEVEDTVLKERMKQRQIEGTPWEFDLRQEELFKPKPALGEDPDESRQIPKKKGRQRHDAAFFPFAHLEDLDYMRGVVAMVGGSRIEIGRLSDDDAEASDGGKATESRAKFELLANAKGPKGTNIATEMRGREEPHGFLSVAWSIRLDTWPYLPVLAVAGKSRLILIYHLDSQQTPAGDRAFELVLDRTLSGQGGRIWSLRFHPHFPHALASASDDRTVCLWDPCVEGGTDDELLAQVQERATLLEAQKPTKSGKGSSTRFVRPFVEGELLAKFTEQGHKAGVLCVDFHPKLPLIISSGMDAFIKIWTIPSLLLGPSWPSPLDALPSSCTAPRLTAKQPQLLGPPLFSSANVHSGQWVAEVRFLGSDDATVFSRAQLEHVDGGLSSSVVKIWIADKLNPTRMGEEAQNAMRARRNPLEEDLKPQGNRPLAFKVRLQIDLTDPTYHGCTLGLHRIPTFPTSLINELFIVYPTSTPPLALLTLMPRSLRQFGEPPPDSSQAEKLKHYDEAMWPPTRKRPMYDHFPRMSPAAVTDVDVAEGLESVVFRAIAVEPEGGRFLLGVGDGGLRAVWRVQRREDVKQEDVELAEETERLSVA